MFIYLRSLIIWGVLMLLILLNESLRDWLLTWADEKNTTWFTGITLCSFWFFACIFMVPILGRAKEKSYWLVGLLWMVLTILVESLREYSDGTTFTGMLKDYDITSGNLWLVDVLFIGALPWITAKARIPFR